MSAAPEPTSSDHDLASIAEARALTRRARAAWSQLAELSQERIDAIVDAVAEAATAHADAFARHAVDETGYGVFEDKVQKNLFASQRIYAFIRPLKTVGVVARHPDRGLIEIAEPFGVVAAIVPSTNPTSTTIYKVLVALKARCTIVLSPHPAAVGCITHVAEVLDDAARRAGAPPDSIAWMKTVTLEGTQELMKHRDVAVILATGGMGLVRAAYSAGEARLRRRSWECARVYRADSAREESRAGRHHRQDVRQRRLVFVREFGGRRSADRRRGAGRVPGPGWLLPLECRGGGGRPDVGHATAFAQSEVGWQVGANHRAGVRHLGPRQHTRPDCAARWGGP